MLLLILMMILVDCIVCINEIVFCYLLGEIINLENLFFFIVGYFF